MVGECVNAHFLGITALRNLGAVLVRAISCAHHSRNTLASDVRRSHANGLGVENARISRNRRAILFLAVSLRNGGTPVLGPCMRVAKEMGNVCRPERSAAKRRRSFFFKPGGTEGAGVPVSRQGPNARSLWGFNWLIGGMIRHELVILVERRAVARGRAASAALRQPASCR